jgi:hypothetical protein
MVYFVFAAGARTRTATAAITVCSTSSFVIGAALFFF